jgi:hypothetical protein
MSCGESNRGGCKLRTFGLIALAMALWGRSAQAQDEMYRPNGLPDFIRRFTSPDHVALETAHIPSIPREPLLNPCL